VKNPNSALLFVFICVFSFASPSEAREIRVLSFNAWFLRIAGVVKISKDNEQRLASMPDELAASGADIIALQEVWNSFERNALKKAMYERGYHYVAEKNDLSCLWFGNGLLVFSRYEMSPIVDYTVFSDYTLCEEYFTMKGAIRAQINVPDLGWIDFYTTHLGAISFDESTSNFNQKQQQVLLGQAQEFIDFFHKTRSHPIQIVAGDMNEHPFKWDPATTQYNQENSGVYQLLIKEGALEDTFWSKRHPHEAAYTFDKDRNPYVSGGAFSGSPSMYIDYIFIGGESSSISTVDSQIVFEKPILTAEDGREIFLSDHAGVLTTFATP
jgi:endonuclease/exonuclease/phosphatase family metal-dependent hydrolase